MYGSELQRAYPIIIYEGSENLLQFPNASAAGKIQSMPISQVNPRLYGESPASEPSNFLSRVPSGCLPSTVRFKVEIQLEPEVAVNLIGGPRSETSMILKAPKNIPRGVCCQWRTKE